MIISNRFNFLQNSTSFIKNKQNETLFMQKGYNYPEIHSSYKLE